MLGTNLQGEKIFGDNVVEINVQVLVFEEDGIYFSFLPALDLTGYGNNQPEAMESLKIVLDEFLRYTLNKNTLSIELQRLGWTATKKNKPIHAPAMSDLINSNDQLKDIVNSKQYSTSNYQVQVPAFA